ncbi:MAG TPA: PEP/pyruvate-binding domain-containing protein, partial [Tepidisphaeraceae bacterium]
MKLILTAADRPTAAEAGGKAAALARFPSLPVPAWFVVTAEAFRQSVPDPINGDFRVAPHVVEAIQDAMKHFASDEPLAVRSSAVDEDGSNQSFAGQLESYLFVPPGKAIDRIVSVWRSAFTERVYAYRAEHGLSATPSPPAVLVQRVVHSDTSGVAFAADPVSGDRSIAIISAVFGLGTSLVGGDADADVYRVSGSGEIVEQKLAHKTLSHVADPDAAGGIRTVVSEDRADEPALLPWQVKQVAQLVREVSRLEGRPQDIEWAYEGDRLFLLQSRPITSLSQVADPHGSKAIWDNSNIAESYNGVTTPLTFSFAQRAYEGAYRGFCELMKVPAKVIADNDAMFGQMLGLIRGRIYYNLLNWYRLLAMLPGFSVNQQFMEQMMGVREGLPAEIAESVLHKTWSQRQADRLRLAWSGGGLVWNHFVLPRKIKGFYKRLDHAMAPPALPLADMRLDQLTAEFRKLESQLLSRWDAPLINDFLAMIFFGVLGKTTAKWCGGDENLHNDLVSDEGGIISTEPVRRISEMASLIASDQALIDALCEAD